MSANPVAGLSFPRRSGSARGFAASPVGLAAMKSCCTEIREIL
jgi:hypothetical protein